MLHVTATSGGQQDVHVRCSTCEERAVTTDGGVSQVTQAQLEALLGPLSTGYGYAAPLPAR